MSCCFRFFNLRYFLACLCLLMTVFSSDFTLAATATVVDDGNNLRAWGGDRYNSAAILAVLNQGDHVRVWEKRGKWTQVTTPDGIDGWVHSACLRNAPDEVVPQWIDPQLRGRIEDYLKRLRRAGESRRFSDLKPLLDPAGLVIQGRVFPDAGSEPSDQRPAVVSVWYATDVSLTYGTAWELLSTGAHPKKMNLVLDKATETWQPARSGEKSGDSVEAMKEDPLLPTHQCSLALAGAVLYVDGYPERLKGIPEPESFLEDPRTTPFGRVYKVGKASYLLTPEKGVGLTLLLVDRPEGMVLRSIHTQSP